ncbi:hypothetical protein [Bacillus sp. V5-8f]|uniref:hypothetical protein n=1 Tax=Bacillus sp. V5-8f TaxID=2053044 RepID=UPI000C77AE21|nr:hypothetical protein [Bacillus sp. V5-8f]PLT32532.1 hypothetical protein CUU64_18685 [Bacillus sp. V5-8f]
MDSSIYKKVQGEEDFEIFYNTLMPSWIEMNYVLECVLGDVTRYIVYNNLKQPIGTAEAIPYKPNGESYLDQFFPFKDLEIVKQNYKYIVEAEGLTIHPKFRGKHNLDRLLYTLVEHCRINNIKYAVALINPSLYVLLKRMYKIPIEKVGNEYISNFTAYPIIIDAQYMYKNIHQFSWLLKLYEVDNNTAKRLVYQR